MFALAPINAGELLVVWGGQPFTLDDIRFGRAAPGSTVAISEELYLGRSAEAYDRERDDRGDFINHSCEPNVWLVNEVTLAARHDIAKAQEITMDYAMIEADENYVSRWECRCGSSLCRGQVTGADWRLPALQQRYAGHFSPFITRRIGAHLHSATQTYAA